MAASDFLQLPSGTDLSFGNSTSTAPAWYQAYQQALLGKASAIAGEGYQAYPGARLADFTPDTLAAWDRVRSTTGQGADMATQGANMVSGAGAGSALSAADPYFSQAAGKSAAGAAQPYVSGATGTSVAGNVQGALEASTTPWTQVYQDYMNPYTDSAVNRMAQVASRNLTENVLPGVNSTFTGAGQFGSSRNFDFNNRAIRDTQEAITGQAGQMYNQAYNDSAGIYNTDATRNINATSQYGTFQDADLNRLLQAAGITSNATSADAALLGQLGTARGQLSAGDLSRQLTAGQALGTLGGQVQNYNQSDAAALESIGNEQQGQNQRSLDLGYNDWTAQKNYPLTQLQIMQAIMNGQPIPGAGTSTASGTPSPTTSPLAMLLSLGLASQAGGRPGTGAPATT